MGLRVACNADPKEIPVLLADVAHQVQRTAEAALHRFKVILALGGIAAQR
jgi:hypothetical protein